MRDSRNRPYTVDVERPTSILIVAAGADDRRSTEVLRLVERAAKRRSDVDVTVWFLREGEHADRWAGRLVVDSLRTWKPAAVLDAIGAATLAARLRGARLRWWYRQVAPDVVVLDDGLGARVIPPQATPVIVERINEEPTMEAALEVPSPRRVNARFGTGAGVPDTPMYDIAAITTDEEIRRRLGVPTGAPVVIGWGHLPWWHAPDVFIRTIWHLERRLGRPVHGIWFLTRGDSALREHLGAEVARCDMDSSIDFRGDAPPAEWAGDAVMLPYRGAPDLTDVLGAACNGIAPVTFSPVEGYGTLTRHVDYLDLVSAAERLAEIVEAGPDDRLMDHHPGLYPDGWLNLVIDQARGGRRWPNVSV